MTCLTKVCIFNLSQVLHFSLGCQGTFDGQKLSYSKHMNNQLHWLSTHGFLEPAPKTSGTITVFLKFCKKKRQDRKEKKTHREGRERDQFSANLLLFTANRCEEENNVGSADFQLCPMTGTTKMLCFLVAQVFFACGQYGS